MGRFFNKLTKTWLEDSSGNRTFYDSPQDALNAGNAALQKAPHPAVAMVPPSQVNVTPAATPVNIKVLSELLPLCPTCVPQLKQSGVRALGARMQNFTSLSDDIDAVADSHVVYKSRSLQGSRYLQHLRSSGGFRVADSQSSNISTQSSRRRGE
jgi:hypothetical protein